MALTAVAVANCSGRRKLMVLRAGDASLHREWLAGPRRGFDGFISHDGSSADHDSSDTDFYEARRSPKWPCIGELLGAHPELVARYDTFRFPDDDLSADTATLDWMFAFFDAYQLAAAQPALAVDSYHSWPQLLQRPDCDLRHVKFVEVMAPISSREALHLCAPSFSESRSAWGLDRLWPALCSRAGLGRLAVIDATPVRDTRPIGGNLYQNNPEMNPLEDEACILQSHDPGEVRSLGKSADWSRVKEVQLPAHERLALRTKRLNARRRLARRR